MYENFDARERAGVLDLPVWLCNVNLYLSTSVKVLTDVRTIHDLAFCNIAMSSELMNIL